MSCDLLAAARVDDVDGLRHREQQIRGGVVALDRTGESHRMVAGAEIGSDGIHQRGSESGTVRAAVVVAGEPIRVEDRPRVAIREQRGVSVRTGIGRVGEVDRVDDG